MAASRPKAPSPIGKDLNASGYGSVASASFAASPSRAPQFKVAFGRHLPEDKVRYFARISLCTAVYVLMGPSPLPSRARAPPWQPQEEADDKFAWEKVVLEDTSTPCALLVSHMRHMPPSLLCVCVWLCVQVPAAGRPVHEQPRQPAEA